ncbi:MAG: KH domain-containing protein [Patescibacteria group bacterium]
MERDEQFVQDVVKAIVDNPDKVSTARTVDEMGVLIELTVDPADMGKIIGKEGKTAKSIRTLLRVLGAKNNARVNLKIVEPEGSDHVRKDEKSEESAEEKVEEKNDEMSDIPGDVLDEE